jgi:hypothetical protein
MRKLLFLLSISILFTYCSDDDVCTIEDWEGTYIGTKNLNGEVETNYGFEIRQDVIITTETSISNRIIIDGQIFLYDECTIVGSSVVSPSGPNTFEGGLDGDQLNLTVNSIGGSCTWIATKQ